MPEKKNSCTDTGSPSLNICLMKLILGILNIFSPENIVILFLHTIINIIVAISCAITVASAAPLIPIAGKGPKPKIIIGSSIIFKASPMEFIIKGVKLLPKPLNIPAKTGFKKKNIIPKDTITK